ncbi:hypothetical protein ACFL6I_20365, partial [candidate division KSB1 bacterium]
MAFYENLTWDKEGSALAVLKGVTPEKRKFRENVICAFTNITEETVNSRIFEPENSSDFPEGMVISENENLSWSKDLSKLFFGIREQEEEQEKKDDEPAADVDIFHWKDDRIQTVQKARAEADRNFTYSSVFDIKNGTFVRLADKNMRSIEITEYGS